ncbi:alpha/beta hydrolase [Chishuiella sp.]|uniref:alpha/beta hydrolase n=1 Tax=Chishuiella sp. TaxID=1969467 RepID=UPI0028A81823|nr:alpha/beta hydrolase-fold protein [Chishuiella sp.]
MKSIFQIFTILFFIQISLISCKTSNNVNIEDTIPIHETFTIDSKKLNEKRVINIWYPNNYKSSKDSLTVVYMPDGGIAEDFPHVANTLEKLIKEKKIQDVILVGIENIQRRKDLTPLTEVEEDKKVAPIVGGASVFRSFIKDELFPEIDKRYRTNKQKAIIGESLAGLFITETFLDDSNMFDIYVAIDPSLWWNNHYLVKKAKAKLLKLPSKPIKFWFAGSDATDINQYTNQLSTIFEDTKAPQLKWFYSDEPKENHATIYRATEEKSLIWSLSK